MLAFSDANSFWRPDALRRLVDRFADPEVGYVCGQVTLHRRARREPGGRLLALRDGGPRARVGASASVTAGNGAIYAVRREAYVEMPSDRGHDLCLPYLMVRKGLRAVYEPAARAEEPMAPTMSGEWERKRRMMNRTWGVLLHDRMLSPRGYGPLYAYEMLSHRALRYASPFLHLIALAANIALLGEGTVYIDHARGSRSRCSPPPRSARVIPAWPLRIAVVLRVGHRLDRRRPDRPHPLGAGDDLGARGGNAVRRRGLPPRRSTWCWPALGLVISSPVLLIAAIAIKLDSRGPVFYRQQRVGLDGAMFEMWKLRTMTHGAPLGGIWDPLTKDDPRVTRAARSCADLAGRAARTCSTSCAARWRSSARARRSPSRWRSTRPSSAGASR